MNKPIYRPRDLPKPVQDQLDQPQKEALRKSKRLLQQLLAE